jgi:hypothetical protein
MAKWACNSCGRTGVTEDGATPHEVQCPDCGAPIGSPAGLSMEPPDSLLARLRLGREEYCQRLLTMLILDGPYPRWNTRHAPSDQGRRFLELLEELSFGEVLCSGPLEFVDELDLGKRPQDLKGSAPDWAVFTPQRLWIIELKTERGSHRDAQVPTYVATGRHYYPDLQVDLTYLTGSMPEYSPGLPEGTRYAHLTWQQVVPLVEQVWGGGTPEQHAVADRLHDVVSGLGNKWAAWRDTRLGAAPVVTPAPAVVPDATAPPVVAADPVDMGIELARMTAEDHQQRGLDHEAGSLEALRAVGRDLTAALSDEKEPALAHVAPWLWNVDTSTGTALTATGSEVGYELRLSWYTEPQR